MKELTIVATVVVLLGLFHCTLSQPNNSTIIPKTTIPTTLSPDQECRRFRNCSTCLKVSHCLWCYKGDVCKQYPVGHIIPRDEDCPLDQARWLVCWFNLKILIIVMSVLAGVILITCGCTIYCCCCRTNKAKLNRRLVADETKLEKQKDDRKAKNDEKRAERKQKTDEIRRKYGLMKEDTPYQRFDA